MTDINKILSIVTVILLVVLSYFVFRGSSKLNEAVKTLNEVSAQVKSAKDSLNTAQQSIEGVMKKLEFSENELRILKANRDLLELEEQRRKAANWNELQGIKGDIKKNEALQDSLKKAASLFPL
jgi:cell shape-determining protein MreC